MVLKRREKWTLGVGENFANIDPLFEGDLSYSGAKTLSNNQKLAKAWIYFLVHLQLATRS